jgi:hypothetical protein
MRQLFAPALVSITLVACGSPSREGPDAPGGPCTGNETRCVNDAYQTCQDGEFVTEETCNGSTPTCSVSLGGCAECDPAAGNGCNGPDVVTCNADGTYGAVVETCDPGSECQGGQCARACTADGVDLIYVVDEAYNLLSFDPRLIGTGTPFRLIGQLLGGPQACTPTLGNVPGWAGIGVTPFSMAVDRTATAWVLYTSGEIFKVSTQDASCTSTGYLARQANMLLFGMGFVSDAVGSDVEHLFIGGGDVTAMTNGQLGSVDPTTYQLTLLGPITAVSELSPELTGTGAAELWAFYPGINTAYVQQINKTNGMPQGSQLAIPGGLGATVTAWAFAQWGGQMYIFVTTDNGGGEVSTVRRIDKMTGAYDVPLPNIPYKIVGAGVSTCAPVIVE